MRFADVCKIGVLLFAGTVANARAFEDGPICKTQTEKVLFGGRYVNESEREKVVLIVKEGNVIWDNGEFLGIRRRQAISYLSDAEYRDAIDFIKAKAEDTSGSMTLQEGQRINTALKKLETLEKDLPKTDVSKKQNTKGQAVEQPPEQNINAVDYSTARGNSPELFVGPRGGVYHYTKSGNKAYESSGHHRR